MASASGKPCLDITKYAKLNPGKPFFGVQLFKSKIVNDATIIRIAKISVVFENNNKYHLRFAQSTVYHLILNQKKRYKIKKIVQSV
jgi:hypothetical protein